MRIAFDARSLASPVLRGWDRYTVGLVGELIRQGVEVALFHRERQVLHPAHVANLGCQIVGLSDRGGTYWEQIAVPLALRRGNFDLFHAPAERGVPLLAPCPVTLTIHSVTLHSYASLVSRGLLPGRVCDYLGYDGDPNEWSRHALYWRGQLARVNHVFTPSEFCRNEVLQFLSFTPEQVTTTPLAVHEQFQRPANTPDVRAEILRRHGIHKPYLLYVGGYEPHKNVDGLLETFTLVHTSRPDLSLVVVGSKALPDKVRRKAVDLGLELDRDVVFLVDVTEELTDIYDGAELFVTLSWRETFCLPALEAMTRGIPVIASAWGATPEIVSGGGRLVDPRDHQEACNTILELSSPAIRNKLGERARQTANRFNWASTAGKTISIYHRLLGRNGSVSAKHPAQHR